MQSEVIPDWERKAAGWLVRNLWLRGRRGGPWAPPAALGGKPVTFEGNTGATLAGTWFAAERPRGAVVLAHPDRRYGQAWFWREGHVAFLLENGFDVLTFDFTGYGASVGPSTYFHEDVEAAARFAQAWAGGFPVHVWGVSMGAFAAANASPRLRFVESMVLEAPYPSFSAWYGQGLGRWAMDAFDRAFPRTGRAICAGENVGWARPRRVLVAYSRADEVTPAVLSEAVADAAPRDRTERFVLDDVPHLAFFAQSERYREHVLAHLVGETSVRVVAPRDAAARPQTPTLPSP